MCQEIDIWKKIIGKHCDCAIKQDTRNKHMRTRDATEISNNASTNVEIIPAKMWFSTCYCVF